MYEIIINPKSKSGLGIKVWQKVEAVLKEKDIDYKAFFTESSVHASKLAHEITLAPGEHKLIVMGGDGTLNDIMNGISEFDRVTIGYIPAGSSNDLARDVKITSDTLKRLDNILSEKNTVLMDIGEITYNEYDKDSLIVPAESFKPVRRFSVSAGIGFDAAVCADISTTKAKSFLNKIKIGKFSYLATALKQLFTMKKEYCEITIDDNAPIKCDRLMFAASMIHRYEGGGFMFCPHAAFDDKKLDMCIVGDVSALKVLFALPTAFFGKHLRFKGISEARGTNIHIQTKVPMWVHTDGEVSVKATDIDICCNKYNVKFIL